MFFFFKQKTAYEFRISDWSSDVCSSDLDLISEYFHAVRHVFHDAWDGHTPKTSRLVHGVGITAMGFVMEYLHSATGATKREQFIEPLTALRPATSWTEGEWELGTERRRWTSLQHLDRKSDVWGKSVSVR